MLNGSQRKYSDEELLALGLHKCVIGIPGRPLPIMVPNPQATNADDAYRLEAIEDEVHPIIIWSRRPYEEVMGLIYRLLPTPSMLPLFYETLQLLQVENDRRIQFYIGKHGSGKSFLGRLVGDLLHDEGPITINCADRDLNELLFETVLDVGANPDLYTRINERLQAGTLNQASINALKDVVGDAYSTNNGKPWIDFERVGSTILEKITDENGLVKTEAVFNGAKTHEVVDILLRIAQVEGLAKEASFMPIKTQLGLLPSVWNEGRVVHLEEYNKCKEGSDTCLHPVLQVFNGENAKCRVYGSGGMNFAFDNAERWPCFFCYLDGNMQADGVATHTLSASANDRILPNIIQDMIQDDWQHRWCQMLCGLPVKILYESKRDQWDANPEAFTKFLHMIRGLGGVKVPDAHRHYIDRWEDVLDATEIISKYNNAYDQMTNPDSQAFREGKFPELFTEVDEEFYNMAGGSMRRNIYYFKMAMLGRPATKQPHLSSGYDLSQDWSKPPELNPNRAEYHPEEKLGTYIVEIFHRDMVRLTLGVGKVNLYMRLKVLFESLRMMRPALSEGMKTGGVYLEDLLNGAPQGSNSNLKIQEILCDQLRANFPNTPLSKDNNHIVTLDTIAKGIDKASKTSVPAATDARQKYIMAQNYAPLVSVENMFLAMALLDSTMTLNGRSVSLRDDDAIGQEHLLAALAIPKIGQNSLRALWNESLILSIDSPLAQLDEALQISCGVAGSGLSMTTLVVGKMDGGKGGLLPMHVLRDARKDHVLIVGESISEKLKEFLKEAKIEFVDRYEGNARTRIQTFLNRLLIQAPPETEKLLVASFFHRNSLPGFDLIGNIDRLDTFKLAELLSNKEALCERPVFATRLSDPRKIQAYLEQSALELEMKN
ncbi:MAG: hypothetical protein IPN95_21540 [Bacteroidetes bacterium]|nr:hypothetical protein [Bacteroidota bacterium]